VLWTGPIVEQKAHTESAVALPHGTRSSLELNSVNGRAPPAAPRKSRLNQTRAITLLCGAGLLTLAGCGGGADRESVEVGVAMPFTSTGVMLEARQAWQLVVEQVEADGGVNHKALQVVERDTPLDDADDVRPIADGFIDLTNQGYKYIISLLSGSALQPMMEAAMPNGVLAMSITSEDPAATLPEYDGMLLRGILPTDRLIQKQALALQGEGLGALAIVGETVQGQVDVRHAAMREAYAACAECRVTSVTYPAEADLYRYDWRAVGAEVMLGAPDVIYLTSANAPALLDTIYWAERSGYTGLYYFAHGAFLAGLQSAMPGSEVPERFRSYDLALPPNEHLEQFQRLYEARYGDSFVPEPRLIAFADYLALLALAMTRVGDDDPRAVAATMKELAGPPGESFGTLDYAAAAAAVRAGRDIDFFGLSGPLDFDARGEVTDGFIQEYGVAPSGAVEALPAGGP
jgi:ABC-type branched-subunit amino acid transport system substrate-binding protein